MTIEQFANLKKWYLEFADSVISGQGKIGELAKLKLEHSFYVASDCREVATELGWDAQDIITAETLGLFHDVGRYPQLAKYCTFSDPDSINHGECGYQTVLEHNVFASIGERDRIRILDGIRYHNARILPDLSADSLPFVKLVRDADKLDIYRIISDAVRNKTIEAHPEITLDIDINGAPNPKAIEQIRNKEIVSYVNIKSLVDFGLTELSWVYDINYPQTMKKIHDRNIFPIIAETLPDTPECNEIVAEVTDFMLQRIEEESLPKI
jgi:hypothetical protein